AAGRALRRREAGDVFAVERDAPARRLQLARDQVEVRRLAGAVRPDDGGEGARREGAGNRVARPGPAEADRQAVRLEDGGFHPGTLTCCGSGWGAWTPEPRSPARAGPTRPSGSSSCASGTSAAAP